MSYERVIKALTCLGLTQTDAKVYIHLATTGPQNARNISEALGIYKQQLYRSLNRLKSIGIASATAERPALYSVVPFITALNLFVKDKMEEADNIERSRRELLFYWQSANF